MNNYDIIFAPIITEKSAAMEQKENMRSKLMLEQIKLK